MPLIPAVKSLHSKFQVSKGYKERPCLKKMHEKTQKQNLNEPTWPSPRCLTLLVKSYQPNAQSGESGVGLQACKIWHRQQCGISDRTKLDKEPGSAAAATHPCPGPWRKCAAGSPAPCRRGPRPRRSCWRCLRTPVPRAWCLTAPDRGAEWRAVTGTKAVIFNSYNKENDIFEWVILCYNSH